MAGNACAAVPASSQVDLPSGFPLCRKFCPVVKLPGSSRTQTNTHLHIRRPYLHQRLWIKERIVVRKYICGKQSRLTCNSTCESNHNQPAAAASENSEDFPVT